MMETVEFWLAVCGGVSALAVALYLAVKRGRNQILVDTLQLQGETIDALKETVELGDRERVQMKQEIAELKAELAGRKQGLLEMLEAVINSDICLRAPECENRVVPAG